MTNPVYVEGGAILGYPGPIGPQGPAGTGVVWKGDFTSETTYVLNDAVSFEGQSFVLSVATVTGVEPGGEEWSLLAARGGPGPAGPQGEIGERGLRGFTGVSGLDGSDGDDGRDGSLWHVGTGAPDINLGNDTDLYLDSATGNVYANAAHVWSLSANIKGPKGDRGDAGTGGGGGVTDYNDLENRPSLSAVALTGQWTDILSKPVLFDGNYNSLTNRPDLFSGLYGDLTGSPTLSAVAISGQWSDIQSKPVLFDGNYNSLSNRPVLFDGSWNSLTSKPVLFSGSYEDLTNKPVLFDGTWTSLSGKPALVGNVLSPTSSLINNLIFTEELGSGVSLSTANSGSFQINGGNIALFGSDNGGGTGDILLDTTGNVSVGPTAAHVQIAGLANVAYNIGPHISYETINNPTNKVGINNAKLLSDLDANGNAITNLKTPVAAADAASKGWTEDYVASKLPEEWTGVTTAGVPARLYQPGMSYYFAPAPGRVYHYQMIVSGAADDGSAYGTFEFTGTVRSYNGTYDGAVATTIIGRSSAGITATAEVGTNGLSVVVGSDATMVWKSITTLRAVN